MVRTRDLSPKNQHVTQRALGSYLSRFTPYMYIYIRSWLDWILVYISKQQTWVRVIVSFVFLPDFYKETVGL